MSTSKTVTPDINWSITKKICFRFFFSYFALFIFTSNNGAYPYFYHISNFFDKFLYKIIPSIGKRVLGIDYKIYSVSNGIFYSWKKRFEHKGEEGLNYEKPNPIICNYTLLGKVSSWKSLHNYEILKLLELVLLNFKGRIYLSLLTPGFLIFL